MVIMQLESRLFLIVGLASVVFGASYYFVEVLDSAVLLYVCINIVYFQHVC